MFLLGFTAAIAQIVLLRELMVVFSGNETSLGLMLASWLFWTAAGSCLVRTGDPRRRMAAIQTLAAVVLPATILAVRASRGVLEKVPGEVLGPGSTLLTALVTLAPLCLLCGGWFAAASRLYGAPRAYWWEALGASAGGLAAALVLLGRVGPLAIAGLLGLVNLLAAARVRRLAPVAGLAALAAILLTGGGPPRRWYGLPVIATRESVYGSLVMAGAEGSRSLYENGVPLAHAPDPAAAEEAVHYALLEHAAPRSLLLIGGGMNGSIAEALRHPTLERLDYVELDPAILDLARDSLPADPRVRIHVTDGRLFVQTTGRTFDVVIVNLPEPQNAQLNRFYTVEFFREAAAKLAPGGLLSFQVRSSENYLSPELAQFLTTLRASLQAVFPEVVAFPGETVHFFAAQRGGTLVTDAGELLARLRARGLRTSYVSEHFLPFRLTPERVADLERQIRPDARTRLNRDFAPVAYFYDAALWSSQFHPAYGRLFGVMAGVPFGAVAAVLAVGLGLAALPGLRRGPGYAAGFATASTGFAMMGLEVLLLLAFQALYGYVYQQLAVVMAAFMAGMALGSWLGMRPGTRADGRALGLALLAAGAAPFALLGLVRAGPLVFPLFAAAGGALGGYEFAIAGRVAARPGRLYALDLAGSCAGAVLFSLWFVPVFGFLKTAALAALVCLAPAPAALREAIPAARRIPGR